MTTEQNLGDVIYSVRAPEEAIHPKTSAVTNLILLLPSLLAAGFIGLLLSQNSKLSPAVVWGVSIGIGLVIAALTAWVKTRWSARYAEQVLEIREHGVSGVRPISAHKSVRFAIPYSELKSVEYKKDSVWLRTDREAFFLLAENAEEWADKLRQIGNIR